MSIPIKTNNQANPPSSTKGVVDADYTKYKVIHKAHGATMILCKNLKSYQADGLIRHLQTLKPALEGDFIKIRQYEKV